MVDYSGSYAAPRLDLGVAFLEFVKDEALGPTFIGAQVLPSFSTPRKEAKFSAVTRETLLQKPDAKRAMKGAYNRIVTGAKDKSYLCEEYGLEHPVDDDERSLYMNDFDADEAAAMAIGNGLLLNFEDRVQAAVIDTVLWTGASLFTDNSASPWSTSTTDIVGQVVAAKDKVRQNTGMEPNALIIGAAQLPNLLKNADIKKVHFPGAPLLTEAMIRSALAAIFGLEKLLVGRAVRNSAAEGAAFTGADIWGDTYVQVARLCEPGAPLWSPCVGRSFLWAPSSAEELVMEQYREEQTRGDVFRGRHSVDEVIIDKFFAHMMKVKA